MDDLSGLDWSQPAKPSPTPTANYNSASYASLQQPPAASPFASSARSSPFTSGSGFGAPPPSTPLAKPISATSTSTSSKPAHDSFSNLVNFGSASKASSNLTLAQRQEQLDAERKRKEAEQRKQTEAQFGNGQFWDSLGGGSRTASPAIAPPPNKPKDDDDDLFAAFKAETRVDNASHYPPPPAGVLSAPSPPVPTVSKSPALDLTSPAAWQQQQPSGGALVDDDPFGLNQMRPGSTANTTTNAPAGADNDDDDLLGDLGRPVAEVQRKNQMPVVTPGPGKPIEDGDDSTSSSDDEARMPARNSDDPFDKAVGQLMDYGFTPEDARRGLTESGAGINVQAAANWLLDDAHRKAKEKARGGKPEDPSRERSTDGPAWARESSRDSQQRRDKSPNTMENDLTKTAAAMGNSLFKTANSLWKTGQKKMQQAMAEFQESDDPTQPKWMRAAAMQQRDLPRRERGGQATDEAMMLESGGRREGREREMMGRERQERPEVPDRSRKPMPASRDQSPVVSAPSSGRSTPKWQHQQPPAFDSRSRLNKLAKEDDDLPVYVSANRRRTPQPEAKAKPPPQDADEDLLFGGTSAKSEKYSQSQPPKPDFIQTMPSKQHKPTAPPAPKRTIPQIPSSVMATSHTHHITATAHFKLGDYAKAHESYTASLLNIPSDHPIVIVLLTNRALTNLKTGSPKLAIQDADTALGVIGPGGGRGETVNVKNAAGVDEKRDMRDLYGKALSRKAEALEQMERWADASAVWQTCIEEGVGANAVQGRQRCQTALAPKPAPKPKPAAPIRPKTTTTTSSEAVVRLRQANAAAAREDDEKFALAEQVDARIAAWRDGKTENLRALLGSLDQVLWEGSGWVKVSMADLVMANRVKVVYMRAIGKTHPDKLAQDASTEVKLVAATVFSTLNTAWDKFKADNKL